MNYILTGLLLIAFTGCGSSDNTNEQQKEGLIDSSPQNVEKSKTPPAIPKI